MSHERTKRHATAADLYIVVEGECDRALLRTVLGAECRQCASEIVVAGGKWGIDTVGRTLLATRKEPVLVVVDADAVDEQRIGEQRSTLDYQLGQVSSDDRYRIIFAVPTIEASLFRAPGLIEQVLGKCMKDTDWVEAKYNPHDLLQQKIKEKGLTFAALLRRLKPRHLAALRAVPPFADVIAAMHELTHASAAPEPASRVG